MGVILRFSESSGAIAQAIKLSTLSWCSHVETVFDDKHLKNRFYGVLPKTGVGHRSSEMKSDHRIENYEIEIPAIKKYRYMEKLLSQKGKPYDYTFLTGNLFYRNWYKNETSWSCAELIVWAFNECGFPIIRTEHKNRIIPTDLLLSPYLRRIS